MIVRPTNLMATLIVLLLCLSSLNLLQSNADEQDKIQPPTVVNTNSPYWRRPGCYRVGHMRTISIPGCVKFNLSTNACRGYCMSYSIPNSLDLDPSIIADGSPTISQSKASHRELQYDGLNHIGSQAGGRGSPEGGDGFLTTSLDGDQRDVVSVSQCCNMMETEEVVVNLRCGRNETRRLIFKSAKTCECFFCKHV